MAAKKKVIPVVTLAELGLTEDDVAPQVEVVRMETAGGAPGREDHPRRARRSGQGAGPASPHTKPRSSEGDEHDSGIHRNPRRQDQEELPRSPRRGEAAGGRARASPSGPCSSARTWIASNPEIFSCGAATVFFWKTRDLAAYSSQGYRPGPRCAWPGKFTAGGLLRRDGDGKGPGAAAGGQARRRAGLGLHEGRGEGREARVHPADLRREGVSDRQAEIHAAARDPAAERFSPGRRPERGRRGREEGRGDSGRRDQRTGGRNLEGRRRRDRRHRSRRHHQRRPGDEGPGEFRPAQGARRRSSRARPWARRARPSIRAGSATSIRSARPARPSPRISIWPSASAARSSTWRECRPRK